jgi:putative ABC transport system substrate-binding protein
MRRREFIALLGCTAVTAAPFAAVEAQPRVGIRRLGVLSTVSPTNPINKAVVAALVQGLGALGWKEGDNLQIDWRSWGGGDPASLGPHAAELVAVGPDVLLAAGNAAVEAVRRQAKTIPIVFTLVSDPVGMGYVESLARPGGNVTGFSSYDPPIDTKRLQMLTQITPPAANVAVLYNPDTAPYAQLMLRSIRDAAKSLALRVRDAPCHNDDEIEALMAALARDGRGGLVALGDVFNTNHREAIVALAARLRVPAVYGDRVFTPIGGLMSYDTDIPDLFRRASDYINRILKGAKPSDLPVQLPTKFWMTINVKTAKALGVEVPPTLLAIADEVIE